MRQEALKRGVTGWVRNLPDGRVEAVVCGDPIQLKHVLEWARKGPPLARVTGTESEPIPEQGLKGFDKIP